MSHNAKTGPRALTGHHRYTARCGCDWTYSGGKTDSDRAADLHNHVCNALDAAAKLVCHCWEEYGDGGIEYVDRCPRCIVLDELRAVAA